LPAYEVTFGLNGIADGGTLFVCHLW